MPPGAGCSEGPARVGMTRGGSIRSLPRRDAGKPHSNPDVQRDAAAAGHVAHNSAHGELMPTCSRPSGSSPSAVISFQPTIGFLPPDLVFSHCTTTTFNETHRAITEYAAAVPR